MKQTAVEWLMQQLPTIDKYDPYYQNLFNQAKEMEKEQSYKYAEFAIICDRIDMKILNFEDWIKL